MAINVTGTLRKVLTRLEAERSRIDRQIAAIRGALQSAGGRGRGGLRRTRRRKPMSAAARRAARRRMKVYWAKRRAGAARAEGKAGK